MDTEGQELGPFHPVPDVQVLATIQRAERHAPESMLRQDIAAHLGFARSPATSRRLRPQLESLRVAGSLERSRKYSLELWGLTPTGRRRLGSRFLRTVVIGTAQISPIEPTRVATMTLAITRGRSRDRQRQAVARTATSYLPTDVRWPGVSSAGIALSVASARL
jgi:hypothetical protein